MNHLFIVKESEGGTLLEPFLYQHLESWSHKKIKQAIDRNKVTVNGKRIFVRSWFLNTGDRVEVIGEVREDFSGGKSYRFVDVIYEDDALLVTNKPPFVDYDSFVSQVNDYLKRDFLKKTGKRIDHVYLGQMHRLDRETSGLLIFTKKKSANVLSDQFRFREMKKFYLALVAGRLEKEHGFVEERIEKGHFGSGRKVAIVGGEGGKESATEYWVKERYEQATLVRLQIHTGRTHQIRIHMAHQGHPVLGDKIYGRGKDPSIKRQMLHAQVIEFRHPITRNRLRLEAPLPKDMADLIERLRVTV